MIDESRCLLSDLLRQWHKWACGYKHVGGINSSPMFRYATASRGYEGDDAIDSAIDSATCEAVDFQVMEMAPVHRTILQLQARNLVSGASVWSSPRLPADPEERAVILMEARNALMKRLIFCGVI
jgi:hypothetical protein